MTKQELDRIIKYVKKKCILDTDKGEFEININCPFRDSELKRCNIYAARPAVCLGFLCGDIVKGKPSKKFIELQTKDVEVYDLRKEVYGVEYLPKDALMRLQEEVSRDERAKIKKV